MRYLAALLLIYSVNTSEAVMGDLRNLPFDEQSWACLPTDVKENTCGELGIKKPK
jgi:hypothetical protein